jgi:hypothetical protein
MLLPPPPMLESVELLRIMFSLPPAMVENEAFV